MRYPLQHDVSDGVQPWDGGMVREKFLMISTIMICRLNSGWGTGFRALYVAVDLMEMLNRSRFQSRHRRLVK